MRGLLVYTIYSVRTSSHFQKNELVTSESTHFIRVPPKRHNGETSQMVNTNRWDPILNYPGCMGVALRLRLYLNEYLSDLHVFLYQILS